MTVDSLCRLILRPHLRHTGAASGVGVMYVINNGVFGSWIPGSYGDDDFFSRTLERHVATRHRPFGRMTTVRPQELRCNIFISKGVYTAELVNRSKYFSRKREIIHKKFGIVCNQASTCYLIYSQLELLHTRQSVGDLYTTNNPTNVARLWMRFPSWISL